MSESLSSTRSAGPDDSGESLSEDDVFEVLSNGRRRYAYHYLKQAGEEVDIRELTDHVTAREYDKPPEALTATERNRVSTALHQFHLPKMDDCGFVEYDARRGEVALSPSASDLEVYVDVVPGRDVPWSRYYLGLAGVNAVVLLGTAAGVAPFGALPVVSWFAFAVASLLVSALVHTYYTRRLDLGADDPAERAR
ncbi:DUF7344 domain-containing protein [Halomarina ordinaria]|uniref:DUF308 domain-containing protein n=1 Tax=Halomarina ordinaria TaxID=3033939 RepID=A0ABD5U9E6_9EURY|nr:hypothetical protein [Halomarina sp. PSRA2]